MDIKKLKYPIGGFSMPEKMTNSALNAWINEIGAFPDKITAAVRDLTYNELSKRYRPEGWNIRQVVHHCADSHMNAFVRFKLALTEEMPVIKPYAEHLWAELPDGNSASVVNSLDILQGVHRRWVALMTNLTEKEWHRTYVHPEKNREISLQEAAGMYDWHCRHHLAHIHAALSKSF